MSLGKKLLVSALIAATVVIVASAIAVAAPHMGGWNSPTVPANGVQGPYGWNSRGGYGYGGGGYMGGSGYRGFGGMGCMGGQGWFSPSGSWSGRGGLNYPSGGMPRGYIDFIEVSGTVLEVHWSYIVLNVEGEALDVCGPAWFWHIINPTTGSNVEAKGDVVSTINWYGETHTELTPFELTIDGITYGNANLGIPVWNQRDI